MDGERRGSAISDSEEEEEAGGRAAAAVLRARQVLAGMESTASEHDSDSNSNSEAAHGLLLGGGTEAGVPAVMRVAPDVGSAISSSPSASSGSAAEATGLMPRAREMAPARAPKSRGAAAATAGRERHGRRGQRR